MSLNDTTFSEDFSGDMVPQRATYTFAHGIDDTDVDL